MIPILFFRSEKIKIDPRLSYDERKKFIRQTLKRIWLENTILFLIIEIILFFMFYQDVLSGETSLSFVVIIELMLVLASVILCILDGVKLILQNRKINKQQKKYSSDKDIPLYDRENYTNNYSKYFEEIFISDKIPSVKLKTYSNYINEVAVRQIINSKRAEDPLIGVKLGADEILHSLLSTFSKDGKIYATELILLTSGLAGYACQMSAWETVGMLGKSPNFVVFTTTDGRNFYSGDAINNPLITNKYSVWHLAAEMYHELEPAKPLPDIDYLANETIDLVADENYKMWGQINPYEMLSKYKHVWDDAISKKITGFCQNPDEWPILFGFILQKTIRLVIRGKMPSGQSCLEMMMRNALFTSRLDIKNATHPNPAK